MSFQTKDGARPALYVDEQPRKNGPVVGRFGVTVFEEKTRGEAAFRSVDSNGEPTEEIVEVGEDPIYYISPIAYETIGDGWVFQDEHGSFYSLPERQSVSDEQFQSEQPDCDGSIIQLGGLGDQPQMNMGSGAEAAIPEEIICVLEDQYEELQDQPVLLSGGGSRSLHAGFLRSAGRTEEPSNDKNDPLYRPSVELELQYCDDNHMFGGGSDCEEIVDPDEDDPERVSRTLGSWQLWTDQSILEDQLISGVSINRENNTITVNPDDVQSEPQSGASMST